MSEMKEFKGIAEAIQIIHAEKSEAKKQFNPHNEPIIVMKVINKRVNYHYREWIGAYMEDAEKTAKSGHKQYKKVPRDRKSIIRKEEEYKHSGSLDTINYIDPDKIDPETDLPMWRTFQHGEIFLAVECNAIHMEFEEFALVAFNYKNIVDEVTGKTRFDWAEPNEIISNDKGVLIPKYHARYSVENFTTIGLAQKLIMMQNENERNRLELDELRKKIEGNGKR